MEGPAIEVAGLHVTPTVLPHTPHIDELIVQANLRLSHPSTPPPTYPEIAALQALHLDSNPKFVILRRQAEKYTVSKQTKTHGSLHPNKGVKWVEVLYSSLLLALSELLFVPNPDHQHQYLDRIFAWFADKIRYTQAVARGRREQELWRPGPVVVLRKMDNSVEGGRERLGIKKLDEVAPIEARSPTRSPEVRRVERGKTFKSATKERCETDIDLEKSYLEKVGTWRKREMSEYRSKRVSEKLVEEWSLRRAKREEQYIARMEQSSVRIRLASDRHNTETSLSPIETDKFPMDGEATYSYYDFRCKTESPHSPSSVRLNPVQLSPSRIDRLRLLSGLKLPEKGKGGEGGEGGGRQPTSLSLFAGN